MRSFYTGTGREDTSGCFIQLDQLMSRKDPNFTTRLKKRLGNERFPRPTILEENATVLEDQMLDPAVLVRA